MVTINRILCPVDFSEFSRRALEHATTIARWYGASITVLHAYPVPVPAFVMAGPVPPLPPPQMPRSWERIREETLAELASFVEPIQASGVAVSLDTHPGSAAVATLELSQSLPADLIVLGTHGRSGIDRLVLGSVTEKVLRKATCPVLTVPAAAAAPAGEALALFKRILCPVDFSPSSMAALQYALSLAQEADAELLLLHVIEGLPDVEHWKRPNSLVADYARQAEEAALAQFRAAIPEDARSACRPEELLGTGKAYREILRIGSDRDAHLIVMGVHGRNPIDRMLFGSTTTQVVRAASCPVLTLRS